MNTEIILLINCVLYFIVGILMSRALSYIDDAKIGRFVGSPFEGFVIVFLWPLAILALVINFFQEFDYKKLVFDCPTIFKKWFRLE